MVMLPAGSRSIAVTPADVAVVKIRRPMPIQKLAVRRFCTPTKNEAACVVSHAPLESLGQPCPVGSKKSSSASTTLIAPDPEDAASTILELDELWSFVLKKAHQVWVWIALCRKTRQVVGYALGNRSRQTGHQLWESIPSTYRQGHCFTDFWAAYAAVIPETQHTAVGKETGETAHVERWNNTLRQRLARFVRMTLSFSKSVVMHEACLLLFLHRYNQERAILLK